MSGDNEKGYQRDHAREPVRAKAGILFDGQRQDAVITNISIAGARLYAQLGVTKGKEVGLQIGEHGQLNATVIWCSGNEVGLVFKEVPAEMTSVLIGLAAG